MQYILLFIEGFITFISPCVLPMIPIYISYFAGGGRGALKNALGFVLGFTIIFMALGAFAGTLGGFLREYQTALNIITGLTVIIFGLNFMGVLNIALLNKARGGDKLNVRDLGFASSVLFGLVFAVSWTPCVGAFLAAALAKASRQGSLIQGMLMLLVFSMGLAIPFIASAVLIDKLKGAFNFIKRNYKLINALCGGLLVLVGALMMTGAFGYFLSLLTF